ncbi:MAG TPA: hypothetical protein VHY48_06345 [Acidobacteriaceae bacterium]|jgi:streptogramin lyase|nr:hypothetical protein [Acidobacteriaceae bacterium]
MHRWYTLPLPFLFCAYICLSFLTGCSTNFAPDLTTGPTADPGQSSLGVIQGAVHGGQSPISSAEIFLFAAGTTGYASAATSLLKAGTYTTKATTGTFKGDYYATTNAYGDFNLGGDYSCTPGTQVYLVAYEGNPMGRGTYNNTGIMQMVGLGECPSSQIIASQFPYIMVNEVSTVAFAYAMSGFGASATNIGSPNDPLARAAIANAMNTANNIFSVSEGLVPPRTYANPNSTVPQSTMYSLANILADCVNSNSVSGCANLFKYTHNATDESQAIFYIAQNPTANVTNLFKLQGTTPPFGSALTAAPTDWTLPVVYTGVTTTPGNIVFDSSGNAWISDRGANAAVRVTPLGVFTPFNANGAAGSIYSVAVNPADNDIWAIDYTNSAIYRLTPSGGLDSTISTGGLNQPDAITFDQNGNAYVLNTGAQTVSKYSSSGIPQATATYTGLDTPAPAAIAVDSNGNIYIPTNGGCGCMELIPSGSTTGEAYNDLFGETSNSTSIVIDASNHPWTAQSNSSILEGPTSNNYDDIFGYRYFIPSAETTSGGLSGPTALALDGTGNLWASNLINATLSGFSLIGTQLTSLFTGSTTSGFSTGSSSTGANGVAVDPSGNVWSINNDGSVSEVIGLGAPTYAPLTPGKIAQP